MWPMKVPSKLQRECLTQLGPMAMRQLRLQRKGQRDWIRFHRKQMKSIYLSPLRGANERAAQVLAKLAPGYTHDLENCFLRNAKGRSWRTARLDSCIAGMAKG